jgi:uncharacterized membrane protein
MPVTSWPTLIDLVFSEIRTYGLRAPQVTRRLHAALDDLLETVPDERKPPLERQRDLLCKAVGRAAETLEDGEVALASDRLGFG